MCMRACGAYDAGHAAEDLDPEIVMNPVAVHGVKAQRAKAAEATRRAAQEAEAKARARRELGGGAKAGAFVSAGGALAKLGFKCTPTVSVEQASKASRNKSTVGLKDIDSTLASGGDLDAASLEATRITRKHPGGGGLSVAIARQTSRVVSLLRSGRLSMTPHATAGEI